MLSDKRNIQQLVRLMHEHGIMDVVLCPGSRNAPICHTISQTQLFNCHPITDERSAGFFAIGLALATGNTVAVCVTSGSALLNLHPAAAEAFYQQVPLLIISADRPKAWIGQMDGQTMPQPNALGRMVKASIDLPEPLTSEEEWHCNRLLNEAILECTHRSRGPVHINVPISEPIYCFHTKELPEERIIQRIEGLYPEQVRQTRDLLSQSKRRIIILGQKPADKQIGHAFLSELGKGYVTLCEHLANAGEGSIAINLTDELLEQIPAEKTEDYKPDLVITLCGHIVSKKLKQFLRNNPPKQHWHVSPDGSIADLFGHLTTVIEAEPYRFLETLAYLTIPEEENKYPVLWTELRPLLPKVITVEQACVGELITLLPDNAVLHLANSSSVRYAQHYRLLPTITVCCNRGINGIEGSLSSAVGFATATPDRPNFVIIGDLSFFYDQNALWNNSLPNNLHILLLNNGGGKIFETLPVPKDEASRRIIRAQHTTNAESVAKQYGIKYLSGRKAMREFAESKESVILEILSR